MNTLDQQVLQTLMKVDVAHDFKIYREGKKRYGSEWAGGDLKNASCPGVCFALGRLKKYGLVTRKERDNALDGDYGYWQLTPSGVGVANAIKAAQKETL